MLMRCGASDCRDERCESEAWWCDDCIGGMCGAAGGWRGFEEGVVEYCLPFSVVA